ncbi:hypothetical protein ABWH92_02030 [Ahrensia marina]|uniref:hypothetical protein n=1 Tax=Ahrensia marina TaxID=1514904 RepID=UPI0035CEEEFF
MKGVHTRKGSKKKYWRRSVPSALWQRRDELVALGIRVQGTVSTSLSLGTEDQNEAERRALDLEASWRDELSRWEDALRHKPTPLTVPERDGLLKVASALIDKRYPAGSEPKRVCLEQRYSPEIRQAFLDFTDKHPDFPIPSDPQELVQGEDGELYSQGVRAPKGFSQLVRAMRADTLTLHIKAVAGPLLQETLEQSGIQTLHPNDRLPLLVDIAKQVDRYRIANKQVAEKKDYRVLLDVVEHWKALPDLPKAASAQKGETVWDCFERWKIEHAAKGGAPKTVTKYRGIVGALVEYLGTAELSAITDTRLREWRQDLMSPRDGTKPRSLKTIDGGYVAAIKSILEQRSRGVFVDNPAAALSTRTPEPIRNRSPAFTNQEAIAILRASRRADDSFWGRLETDARFACRWVPWMQAFSGARVSEIVQLRKEDLLNEDGVDFYRIAHQAGSVKTRKYRIVPLHPQLLKMGILGELRSRPGPRVFVPPSASNLAGRVESISGSVGDFVRHRVGIVDKELRPTHSWRHRFKNICRKVGIEEQYEFAIAGHLGAPQGRKYGDFEAEELFREIKKLPWIELESDLAHHGVGADDASK